MTALQIAPRTDRTARARALIVAGRRARGRRRAIVIVVLAVALVGAVAASLMLGQTVYSPSEVLRVIAGETVPGASFTVGELRLPRTVTALLAGTAFGLAGTTFQTMLRNPLASPDIIGVSSGASAAAVIAIVVLGLSDAGVSLFALGGALLTALAIYFLSHRGGFSGTRLILIGIGLAAMLNAVVSYVLSRAASWDIQTAMQWLTGSLNGASWERAFPLLIAWAALAPVMLVAGRSLRLLQLGDDSAAGLGVRVQRTRMMLLVGAVALLAFATAAVGPVAFVAFMAGPIAARLVPAGGSPLIPSALVGAILMIVADLIGQFAFGTRYPVGVVTGILGAPYLILLLIRTNRAGGSL